MTTSDKTVAVTGRLENWMFQEYAKGKYIYWGNVYDDIHGRFPDGTWIHTSTIPKFDRSAKEGSLVKTLNSVYLLGKVAKMDAVK